jgi:hypothetical protein
MKYQRHIIVAVNFPFTTLAICAYRCLYMEQTTYPYPPPMKLAPASLASTGPGANFRGGGGNLARMAGANFTGGGVTLMTDSLDMSRW